MRRPQITSIIAFVVLLASIALYQNCSKPISNIDGNPNPECTENCDQGTPGVLAAVLSSTEDGPSITELDMNSDLFMRLTGFASAQDIRSCAKLYRGFDEWCTTDEFRPIFEDLDFTYVNNIGRQSREACTLSNCTFFSHTTYFGSTFQIQYANSNYTKKIKRNVYIRPPHLSQGFNEVAVWYTNDSAGRDRIIHWLNGASIANKLTSYVPEDEPFYSHWYKPSGVAAMQACLKSFTGNVPPAASTCAAADWVEIVSANTTVSADGKHHYNFNSEGFPAGKYITFLRNAANQQVYEHATTIIVVE